MDSVAHFYLDQPYVSVHIALQGCKYSIWNSPYIKKA